MGKNNKLAEAVFKGERRAVYRNRNDLDIDEGDYVTLTVSDTGVGIPPEDIERIFEPFYTKKTMGRSGTGLGMAVVWGTVKDHSGYIDVQSELGKKTTFSLYFPVTREEMAVVKADLSTEKYRGQGESILIVDDVKQQREIASQMLERLGYDVTSVPSGEEALNFVKQNKTDLLVSHEIVCQKSIDDLSSCFKLFHYPRI